MKHRRRHPQPLRLQSTHTTPPLARLLLVLLLAHLLPRPTCTAPARPPEHRALTARQQCPCLLHLGAPLPPDVQLLLVDASNWPRTSHPPSRLPRIRRILPAALPSRIANRHARLPGPQVLRVPHARAIAVVARGANISSPIRVRLRPEIRQPDVGNFDCPVVLPSTRLQAPVARPAIVPSRPRIFGGDEATAATRSFMVSLSTEAGFFACSGVMLSARWALSAAHCGVTDRWQLRVATDRAQVGDMSRVKRVIVHESFQGIFPDGPGDLALIELEEDAPDGVTFVGVNANDSIPRAGSFSRTVGYGRVQGNVNINNPRLNQVDIPVTNPEKCKAVYNGFLNVSEDLFICAGYEQGFCQGDSCNGDSGGPLLQFDDDNQPVLIGLVSFGFDCGLPGIPGVYVRASRYVDWLDSKRVVFNKYFSGPQRFANGSREAADPAPSQTIFDILGETPLPPPPPSEPLSPAQVGDMTDNGRTTLSTTGFVLICAGAGIIVVLLVIVTVALLHSRRELNQLQSGATEGTRTAGTGSEGATGAPMGAERSDIGTGSDGVTGAALRAKRSSIATSGAAAAGVALGADHSRTSKSNEVAAGAAPAAERSGIGTGNESAVGAHLPVESSSIATSSEAAAGAALGTERFGMGTSSEGAAGAPMGEERFNTVATAPVEPLEEAIDLALAHVRSFVAAAVGDEGEGPLDTAESDLAYVGGHQQTSGADAAALAAVQEVDALMQQPSVEATANFMLPEEDEIRSNSLQR